MDDPLAVDPNIRAAVPEEVAERADKAIRENAHLIGKPGYFAAVERGEVRILPWQQSGSRKDKHGNVTIHAQRMKIPDEFIEKERAKLPPRVRREARERFAKLVDMLAADAVKSYRANGRVVWPKSIEDELTRLGWKGGNPTYLDGLRAQVEALARHFTIKAANQQKEKDLHKAVLDHSGHYSA